MFQGLFRRAESTIDNAVAKLVGRAAVAAPLLIAGGFATAALTVWLVEQYGPIAAYGMMAALFSLIALATTAFVSTNGTARPAEEAAPEAAASAETASGAAEGEGMNPLDLFPPEVRTLLASAAPMALPAVARGVGRNLPLIFVLALVGFVISRFVAEPAPEAEGSGAPAPEATPQEAGIPAGAEAA